MKTLEILGAQRRGSATPLLAALMSVGLLAGCGQKGPLYLPASSPVTTTAPKPVTASEQPGSVVVEPDPLETTGVRQP